MSETFQISATERGVIRLFTVDNTEKMPVMSSEPDWDMDVQDPPWPLRDALGVDHLDPEFIEIFDVRDLSGVGLAGYMIEGLGVAQADIEPHRAQLDAIEGHVLIVLSKAFGEVESTLRPKAPLRWIGTYVDDRAPVVFETLSSDAATGEIVTEKKRKPSDAAMSGRVATVALLVLFALTAIVVWVAS